MYEDIMGSRRYYEAFRWPLVIVNGWIFYEILCRVSSRMESRDGIMEYSMESEIP